jgi:hypothetical protein
MYIVGHTALAYLVLRPFLSSKDKDFAVTIFFIFIFANIIDIFNYRFLRYYGHNLIGTWIIILVGAIIFKKLNLIEKKMIPFLIMATGTHVVADIIYSEYYIFAPFRDKAYSVIGFNPLLGQFTEAVLFGIFIIALLITKDHIKLIQFLANEKSKVVQSFENTKDFVKGSIVSLIFIAFILFSILQFFYFIVEFNYLLLVFVKRTWLYFGSFALFILIFAYIGFYDRTKAVSK